MHSQIRILIFIGFSLLLMQEALHQINIKLKQQKHNIIPSSTAIQIIPKFTPFNIIKLTSIDDTQISIENAINYHLNPSILLDENEYQLQSYQPFTLTQPEQLGIKFQEPQIVNMIKFYIKVQKLGYDIDACQQYYCLSYRCQSQSNTFQFNNIQQKCCYQNIHSQSQIPISLHDLSTIEMLECIQKIHYNPQEQKPLSECIPHISVPYKQY